MANVSAEKKMQEIADHKPDVELRIARRMPIGAVVQQGDIYIVRVPDDHPRGKSLGASRQLAVGTATGARHEVSGNVELFAGKKFPDFYREDIPQLLLGPVIVAPESFTVPHPQHPHHMLPKGTYQTTYQLDEATRRAVED
jgi:hypothetical protein